MRTTLRSNLGAEFENEGSRAAAAEAAVFLRVPPRLRRRRLVAAKQSPGVLRTPRSAASAPIVRTRLHDGVTLSPPLHATAAAASERLPLSLRPSASVAQSKSLRL